jgi:hypothetical protein
MAPRILVTHTLMWPNAARLATAFGAVGCSVQLLCRRMHPALKLPSLRRSFIYNRFAPLRSLRAAIEEGEPDLIIPCDDRAVAEIHQLYNLAAGSGLSNRRIQEVIERSLGKPESYEPIATRSKLAAIAMSAEVLLPRTGIVATTTQLRNWLCREGFPAVLKADFTSGGNGIVIIHDVKHVVAAFRRLSGRQNFVRALGALGLRGDPYLLRQRLLGVTPKLSVQTLVHGKLANCAVACWQGKVIAGIAVEVLAAQKATGNATVVQVVDGKEMLEAASRIVSHLGLSGFCGFDFVIEEPTGLAYLLEINPRATQINHLALGKDRNLPAALGALLAGEPIQDETAITDREIIALFPQELERDPHSSFLTTNYHDVPEEPELVRYYLGTAHRIRRFLAR